MNQEYGRKKKSLILSPKRWETWERFRKVMKPVDSSGDMNMNRAAERNDCVNEHTIKCALIILTWAAQINKQTWLITTKILEVNWSTFVWQKMNHPN